VSTPNEAAADSRFSTAVIAGMSRLRKASTSSRKMKPAIEARNQGSLATGHLGPIPACLHEKVPSDLG
jgi:hypothetical protein